MSVDEIKGWQKRLWWSFICAITAVVASTIIVGVLASMVKPGVEGHGGGADIATYIFGFPLAPGWLIVKGIFWRMGNGSRWSDRPDLASQSSHRFDSDFSRLGVSASKGIQRVSFQRYFGSWWVIFYGDQKSRRSGLWLDGFRHCAGLRYCLPERRNRARVVGV
jgi:hypothetical protein